MDLQHVIECVQGTHMSLQKSHEDRMCIAYTHVATAKRNDCHSFMPSLPSCLASAPSAGAHAALLVSASPCSRSGRGAPRCGSAFLAALVVWRYHVSVAPFPSRARFVFGSLVAPFVRFPVGLPARGSPLLSASLPDPSNSNSAIYVTLL